MKALITAKGNSSRVGQKNTRSFAGSSLLCEKIKQLHRAGLRVVVNSENDFILNVAKLMHCEAIKREPYYATDKCSTSDFYYNVAESFPSDTIVFANCTNPLVSEETIKKCIEIYKTGEYESVNTVEKFQHFLLDEQGGAINYDKANQPGSQSLPVYYIPTFAVNVISRKDMMKYKNVIAPNCYLYETDQTESVDIDTPLDFEFAQWLYLKTNR